MQAYLVFSALRTFWYYARAYIWILFARALGEDRIYIAATWLCAAYLLQAMDALILGRLADKYEFPKLALMATIITTVATTIEASTSSFIIFAIASLFSHAVYSIPLSGIMAKLLPNGKSMQCVAFLFAVVCIAYISAPIISAALAYYYSYRMSFIMSAIGSGIALLWVVFFIVPSKKESKPTAVPMRALHIDGYISNESTPEQPLSIVGYVLGMDISTHEWKLLILSSVLQSLIMATDAIFVSYFAVYCKDRFNVSVLLSAVVMSIFLITVTVSMLISGIIIHKRAQNIRTNDERRSDFNRKVMIAFAACCGNIACVAAFMYAPFDAYYLIAIIDGVFIGIAFKIQESIVFETQPKQCKAGVDSFTRCSRTVAKALLILIVGLTFSANNEYSSFWYARLFCFVAAGVCCLILRFGVSVSTVDDEETSEKEKVFYNLKETEVEP